MARTIAEIKTALGNAYIQLPAVQAIYGISSAEAFNGFDSIFSKVSVESLLFYAVAFAINTLEKIQDTFRGEIQETVDAAFVANKAWWHAQALKFQRGDDLVMNPTTFRYEYETVDASKQIIKRVAVREIVQEGGVCKVKIFLATEVAGEIAPLSDQELYLFENYARMIAPAGVLREILTGAADTVDFTFTVYFNPLVMDTSGKLIGSDEYPVEESIKKFISELNNTNFGGRLNLTRLTDAVQNTAGVLDVRLREFYLNNILQDLSNTTYESAFGWFKLGNNLQITYNPQQEI